MKLKEIRESRGLTQKALSELSGVHVIKISQIESEKIKPGNMSLKNAAKLAIALGCHAEDFLKEQANE